MDHRAQREMMCTAISEGEEVGLDCELKALLPDFPSTEACLSSSFSRTHTGSPVPSSSHSSSSALSGLVLVTIDQPGVQTKRFGIHEQVLSGASPLLGRLVQEPSDSVKSRSITLHNVDPATFHLFARFLYGHSVLSALPQITLTSAWQKVFSLVLAYKFGLAICASDFRDAVVDALLSLLLAHRDATQDAMEDTSVRMSWVIWPEVSNDSGVERLIALLAALSWKEKTVNKERFRLENGFWKAVEMAQEEAGVCAGEQYLRSALEREPCLFHDHGERKACYRDRGCCGQGQEDPVEVMVFLHA